MRVSSPIGDLPFTPERIRVSRGGIDVDGSMGAWPAHVHVDAADLPRLARLLPLRVIAAAGAVAALAVWRRAGRSRRG
jgi:hypothetical protein